MNQRIPSGKDASRTVTIAPKEDLYPTFFSIFRDCMSSSPQLTISVVNTIFGTQHPASSRVIFEAGAFQLVGRDIQILPICILEDRDGTETPFRYCIGFQPVLSTDAFPELYCAAGRLGRDESNSTIHYPPTAVLCLEDPEGIGPEVTICTTGQNGEENQPFRITVVNLYRQTYEPLP